MSRAEYAPSFGKAKLKQDDPCPKCKYGFLEQVSHRFSSDRGPNLPDCDWLVCLECNFQTEPE